MRANVGISGRQPLQARRPLQARQPQVWSENRCAGLPAAAVQCRFVARLPCPPCCPTRESLSHLLAHAPGPALLLAGTEACLEPWFAAVKAQRPGSEISASAHVRGTALHARFADSPCSPSGQLRPASELTGARGAPRPCQAGSSGHCQGRAPCAGCHSAEAGHQVRGPGLQSYQEAPDWELAAWPLS